MNIEHISISRSKSYKQCHYYYKLKYHEKIPNPGEEQFWFTYGKIIHTIAEIYVVEKMKRSLGEISTDVLRGKIPYDGDKLAPPLPPEYKRRVPGHLRSIQKITERMGCEGYTEYDFKYDLDPPNGKFVVGFIDRLFIKNNTAFVLDYKTTKKGPYRETKDTIKYDPQLRCYAKVINRNFGIPAQNIKTALYYLEDSELLGACYTQESLDKIETDLLSIYNQIEAQSPDAAWGNVGTHCPRCEYAPICTFYKGKKGSSWGKSSTKEVVWDGDMASLGL